MTPDEIETFARRRYNAIGDNTWSSEEIRDLIYDGELEMARLTRMIENRYSANTVANQREYVLPARTMEVKRIEVNGEKTQLVTHREDDTLRLINGTVTITGVPKYYFLYEDSFFLSPAPSASGVDNIVIYTVDEPQRLSTATQPLDVPTQFHLEIAHYVIGQFALKDLNLNLYTIQNERWKKALVDAKTWVRKRKRGDAFSVVQDEETLATTVAGLI